MENYDATYVKMARGDGIRRLNDPYLAIGHRKCMKCLLDRTIDECPAAKPFIRCSSIRTQAPVPPRCPECDESLFPVNVQ